MKYLLTGHTGFKGSWLALMLKAKGHQVVGCALEPEMNSLFNHASVSHFLSDDIRIEVRNFQALKQQLEAVQPDVIIHLAAQALVRESYLDPIFTFETNFNGTLNLLEATRNLENLKATLIVTTDKVYKNIGLRERYSELDELGGDDPYSASKASADLMTQSWRKSFGKSPIAIARAGNVIGGGDWSRNRIIPDTVRALSNGSPLILRYPNAIRPWQHVLDCLNGYLNLVEFQLKYGTQGEWNFGPSEHEVLEVQGLVDRFTSEMGRPISIEHEVVDESEAISLLLDSTKSRQHLGWSEKLNLESTVRWTADWYRNEANPLFTMSQVEDYLAR